MEIKKWGITINVGELDDRSRNYIEGLPEDLPSVEWVWAEMDRVWDQCGLDNKKSLGIQDVGAFYGHPVWILNGIFTEVDSVSKGHRVAISEFISSLGVRRVADYGGGSGVLARTLTASNSGISLDIVEPFASDFFKKWLATSDAIRFVDDFDGVYDLVIAQDVLEHLEDPVGAVYRLGKFVDHNGYLIFANCFYPVIKCHLPSTFFLRHTFKLVMGFMGLKYVTRIPGADHALVFKKNKELCLFRGRTASEFAKVIGFLVNSKTRFLSNIKNSAR